MRRFLPIGCLLALLTGAAGLQPPAAVAQSDLANGVDLRSNPRFPPPAPLYSDLLNVLQSQVVWETGVLQIDGHLRTLFLPDADNPNSIYTYHPETGARLVHQVKRPDGTVVQTQDYVARPDKAPFWIVDTHGAPPEESLASGDYVLEFLAEGEPFYRFPFTVTVEGGDDPYSPGGRTFFEGPWADYAYLYVANNNPASTPTFSLWLRDKASTLSVKREAEMNVTVARGGQAVAFWPGPNLSNPVTLEPYWERLDLSLRGAGNGTLSAADIMQDGTYTITVTMDGAPYATYRYTAQGGKIRHQDRQVREATDPMAYIEGDTQRYFMKRVP